MEPEGSIPRLQKQVTCPYTEPDQSSPCPPSQFLKIHLNIISHLGLRLRCGLFPSGFPSKPQYAPSLSPVRATHPAHLTIRVFVTRIILVFGE